MKPLPSDVAPDALDAPFWEGCRERTFLLHRCSLCGRQYWPASCCVTHGARAMEWVPSSGRGRVHTFTIVPQAYHPAFAEDVPYKVAVIELDEGPFFHANVVDAPDGIRVGMRVEAVFVETAPGIVVPKFRPSGD